MIAENEIFKDLVFYTVVGKTIEKYKIIDKIGDGNNTFVVEKQSGFSQSRTIMALGYITTAFKTKIDALSSIKAEIEQSIDELSSSLQEVIDQLKEIQKDASKEI